MWEACEYFDRGIIHTMCPTLSFQEVSMCYSWILYLVYHLTYFTLANDWPRSWFADTLSAASFTVGSRSRHGPMINSNGWLDSCECIHHLSLKVPRANLDSDRSRRLEANRMTLKVRCKIELHYNVTMCPGWGKTWGLLKLKRQVVEAFTLFA